MLRPDALGELKRSPDHLAALRGWDPRERGQRRKVGRDRRKGWNLEGRTGKEVGMREGGEERERGRKGRGIDRNEKFLFQAVRSIDILRHSVLIQKSHKSRYCKHYAKVGKTLMQKQECTVHTAQSIS